MVASSVSDAPPPPYQSMKNIGAKQGGLPSLSDGGEGSSPNFDEPPPVYQSQRRIAIADDGEGKSAANEVKNEEPLPMYQSFRGVVTAQSQGLSGGYKSLGRPPFAEGSSSPNVEQDPLPKYKSIRLHGIQ